MLNQVGFYSVSIPDEECTLSLYDIAALQIDYTGDYTPERQTEGSCGYDIRCAEATRLYPNEVTLVPTGLRVAVPRGYHLKVFNRSSLGARGIILANGVGIIDSDYRGEIKLPLLNLRNDGYLLRKGDRIGQLVLEKDMRIAFNKVDSLDETERNEGGFGSTGR